MQTYPTNSVMIFIFVMALIYNFPRFFDTTYTAAPTSFVQRIGNFEGKRYDRPEDFQIVKVSVHIEKAMCLFLSMLSEFFFTITVYSF